VEGEILMLRLYNIVIQNIKRKPFRSLALVLSVAIAAATLFAGTIFVSSVLESVELGAKRLGADVIVLPEEYEGKPESTLISGKPSMVYMDRSVLDKVREVDGVARASPQVFVESAQASCCSQWKLLLVGFDRHSDFTLKPWASNALDRPLKKHEIILGGAYYWEPGVQLYFYGVRYTIAAKIQSMGVDYFDHSAFLPMETVYQMAEESRLRGDVVDLNLSRGQISTVLVKTKEGISNERVAVRTEYAVEGIKAIPAQKAVSSVKTQLFSLLKGLFALSAVIWIVAIVMIGAVFSMIVNERKRELGLLRAMGATKNFVFKEILGEAIFITSMGGVLGVIVGGATYTIFKNKVVESLGVPYLLPSTTEIAALVLATLGLSIVIGAISALYPAYSSSRTEPYEAIRAGE